LIDPGSADHMQDLYNLYEEKGVEQT
jgi:hypothetical protein